MPNNHTHSTERKRNLRGDNTRSVACSPVQPTLSRAKKIGHLWLTIFFRNCSRQSQANVQDSPHAVSQTFSQWPAVWTRAAGRWRAQRRSLSLECEALEGIDVGAVVGVVQGARPSPTRPTTQRYPTSRDSPPMRSGRGGVPFSGVRRSRLGGVSNPASAGLFSRGGVPKCEPRPTPMVNFEGLVPEVKRGSYS
jgi:hypothetical protein